ncbi:MAG: CBS domain-containing protein [Deltaproteobacteria bacterium]|nr:CBS domain-containing protein [Deltaproteobacteria bacterium]
MSRSTKSLLRDKGNAVYSVAPSTSVYDLVDMLATHRIGAAVVLDADRLVGIVSERDYARKVILRDRQSRNTRVSEIMTTEVITVTEEQTLSDCMALITANRVRHLPVVDDNGRVIGMLSVGDILRALIAERGDLIDKLERYIVAG